MSEVIFETLRFVEKPINIYKNVLLIDSNVKDYNIFIDSCNDDTYPLIYTNRHQNYILDELQDKFNNINRIGVVSYNNNILLNEQNVIDKNNVDFIINIIKKFKVKNIDFLACDTLNDTKWTNFYSLLFNATGVIIGASNDKTGNIKFGGDWVMESTSEDVENVYFSKSIEYYKYLLDTFYLVDEEYKHITDISLINNNTSLFYSYPDNIDFGSYRSNRTVTKYGWGSYNDVYFILPLFYSHLNIYATLTFDFIHRGDGSEYNEAFVQVGIIEKNDIIKIKESNTLSQYYSSYANAALYSTNVVNYSVSFNIKTNTYYYIFFKFIEISLEKSGSSRAEIFNKFFIKLSNNIYNLTAINAINSSFLLPYKNIIYNNIIYGDGIISTEFNWYYKEKSLQILNKISELTNNINYDYVYYLTGSPTLMYFHDSYYTILYDSYHIIPSINSGEYEYINLFYEFWTDAEVSGQNDFIISFGISTTNELVNKIESNIFLITFGGTVNSRRQSFNKSIKVLRNTEYCLYIKRFKNTSVHTWPRAYKLTLSNSILYTDMPSHDVSQFYKYINNELYYNNILFNGSIGSAQYVNGVVKNGFYKNILYKNFAPNTTFYIFNGKLYYNNYIFSGVYNDKLYSCGSIVSNNSFIIDSRTNILYHGLEPYQGFYSNNIHGEVNYIFKTIDISNYVTTIQNLPFLRNEFYVVSPQPLRYNTLEDLYIGIYLVGSFINFNPESIMDNNYLISPIFNSNLNEYINFKFDFLHNNINGSDYIAIGVIEHTNTLSIDSCRLSDAIFRYQNDLTTSLLKNYSVSFKIKKSTHYCLFIKFSTDMGSRTIGNFKIKLLSEIPALLSPFDSIIDITKDEFYDKIYINGLASTGYCVYNDKLYFNSILFTGVYNSIFYNNGEISNNYIDNFNSLSNFIISYNIWNKKTNDEDITLQTSIIDPIFSNINKFILFHPYTDSIQYLTSVNIYTQKNLYLTFSFDFLHSSYNSNIQNSITIGINKPDMRPYMGLKYILSPKIFRYKPNIQSTELVRYSISFNTAISTMYSLAIILDSPANYKMVLSNLEINLSETRPANDIIDATGFSFDNNILSLENTIFSGIYNNTLYINGIINNDYIYFKEYLYSQAVKYTGFYENIFYKNGLIFTGVYLNTHYINGVKSVSYQFYDNTLYFDGVIKPNYYKHTNNILYFNGKKATGSVLYGNVLAETELFIEGVKPTEVKTVMNSLYINGDYHSTTTASTSGDPYINTFEGFKYKLPNIIRTYRLLDFHMTDKDEKLTINASVSPLREEEKNMIMSIDKFKKHNPVINGFFYNEFYISTNNSYILLDRMFNLIKCSNITDFEIKLENTPKLFKCDIQGESLYVAKIIHIFGVRIELRLFDNPQILNGIEISVPDLKNTTGLLSSRVNPKNFMIKTITDTKKITIKSDKVYNRVVKENWIKVA